MYRCVYVFFYFLFFQTVSRGFILKHLRKCRIWTTVWHGEREKKKPLFEVDSWINGSQ